MSSKPTSNDLPVYTRQKLIRLFKEDRNTTIELVNLEDLHWFLLWVRRNLGDVTVARGEKGAGPGMTLERAIRFKKWPFPVWMSYRDNISLRFKTIWWYERYHGRDGADLVVEQLRDAPEARGKPRIANMRWT